MKTKGALMIEIKKHGLLLHALVSNGVLITTGTEAACRTAALRAGLLLVVASGKYEIATK